MHRLVLETLTPLPGDRKCFRMINGVLTERTVNDVLPALQTNADGLKKVLEDLVKQYRTKQEEMDKWKVCAMASLDVWASADLQTEEQQYPGCAAIRQTPGLWVPGGCLPWMVCVVCRSGHPGMTSQCWLCQLRYHVARSWERRETRRSSQLQRNGHMRLAESLSTPVCCGSSIFAMSATMNKPRRAART